MKNITQPEVFVIESLDFDDEKHDRYEGKLIARMLALSGKKCKYIYIRTRQELKSILKQFSKSKYRYLHLSCHGNSESMFTTLDCIPFTELKVILKPHLRNRRLFVSACSMTNTALAKQLMPDSGCISILGPQEEILFSDAAILWASLYHVMFSADATQMKRSVLTSKAQAIVDLYRVALCNIRRDAEANEGYIVKSLKPKPEKSTQKSKLRRSAK